jgi:hydroxylamine dehydrogenase
MKTMLLCLFAGLLLCLNWQVALAEKPDFEQVKKNYYDTHPGKGSHGEHWQPIPIQQYWNPKDFYKPPQTIQGEFS